MKHFKQILTILCLLLAGWTTAYGQLHSYTVSEPRLWMGDNGAMYNLYDVTATTNLGMYSTTKEYHFAHMKDPTLVFGQVFVVPEYLYRNILDEQGNPTSQTIQYAVEGIDSTIYNTNPKPEFEILKFKGRVGRTFSIPDFEDGTRFDKMRFSNIRILYFEKDVHFLNNRDKTLEGMPNLTDIYFADEPPYLSSGIISNAQAITLHVPSDYMYKIANVGGYFKDIVPFNKYATIEVNSDGNLAYRFVGKGDGETYYSTTTDETELIKSSYVKGNKSRQVNKAEKYYLLISYDPANSSPPVLYRNGELVSLTKIAEDLFRYEETFLLEDVSYNVMVEKKKCNIFFPENGYKAGTFTKITDTQTSTGYLTTVGNVFCDWGSHLILTMPASKYYLKNNLKITYNGEDHPLPLPNPYQGFYTLDIAVPSVEEATLHYEWDITNVVVDPVVKVMRTGQGDVTLTRMWDWDSQNTDTWYNIDNVNCVNTVTDVVIPYPTQSTGGDGEFWAFTVKAVPQLGSVVRNFMIGRIYKSPDTGEPDLQWEDYIMDYNQDDGSYTFTVDAFNNYIYDGVGNYIVFVDMGPSATEVVDRAELNFVRKGGKSNVIFYREDCEVDGNFEITEGSSSYSLKLYTPAEAEVCGQSMNIEQELVIKPVAGETIHIYCDGEEVSNKIVHGEIYDVLALERANHTYTIYIEGIEDIIAFADPAVKAICVENWDTNGDGELSYEEAAAVTDIGVVFKGNTEITSFDEFQYFTGVTKIGKEAFYGDTELTSIVLPQSVVNIHGGWAFYGCSSLEHVVLPDNIGFVDTATFGQTNISSITFPGNAGSLSLGYGVITHAPLKSLFIPANVKTIYEYVVYNCPNLASISVDEGNTIYDSREGCNAIIKTSDNTLIAGCKNTVIPESVTKLGNYAFFKTDGLTRLELPAGLTSIGNKGIRDCSSLTTIVAHMPEPFEINTSASSNDYNISGLPATCKLIVPYGKRQAYIDAGWTESIFKGGVVEDKSQFDVNRDSSVSIADVTTLVNVILGKPIQ